MNREELARRVYSMFKSEYHKYITITESSRGAVAVDDYFLIVPRGSEIVKKCEELTETPCFGLVHSFSIVLCDCVYTGDVPLGILRLLYYMSRMFPEDTWLVLSCLGNVYDMFSIRYIDPVNVSERGMLAVEIHGEEGTLHPAFDLGDVLVIPIRKVSEKFTCSPACRSCISNICI